MENNSNPLSEILRSYPFTITKVEVNPTSGKWILHTDGLTKFDQQSLEGDLIKAFQGLQCVEFKNANTKNSLIEYLSEKKEFIKQMIRSQHNDVFLPKNNWSLKGNSIEIPIFLKEDFKKLVESDISQHIHGYLKEADGVDLQFTFVYKGKIEDMAQEIQKEKENLKVQISKESASASKKTPSSGRSVDKVIFGKRITSDAIKITDCVPDEQSIILGRAFKIDYKDIKNNKAIIMFNITDYTSSMTVKFFIVQDKRDEALERIKGASALKVMGRVEYDTFAREYVFMANGIEEAPIVVKTDDAEEKRVELHLHSQYSAMDSVAKIEKTIQKALSYGHKALAITDHGVLQGFPEAMEYSKGKDIKIIYGLEGYLVDDKKSAKWGKKDSDLDATFIIFDLETTGLSSRKNEIIEIGAVKVHNHQIVETFASFVKPKEKIPMRITELTGITDSMVAHAEDIEGVLPKFLDFCEDHILVAHNAKFDLSFLEKACDSCNISRDFSVIDTLSLARNAIPEISRHNLKALTKYYKINLENHHRAVDDAMATGKVFIQLLKSCKDKGASSTNDIDQVFDNELAIQKIDTYHIIILVKNTVGLKNLYKLVSMAHLNYFYKRPRIPKSILAKYREGLIIGSACESGELYRSILNEASDEEIENIANFYDYLEIQPLGNNQFLMDKNMVSSLEDLMDINKKIIQVGKNCSKPVVATGDVHFLEPHDEYFRRILMHGQGFSDADNQAPLYYRTTQEMLDEFYYLDEEDAREVVITNPNKIADTVEKILPIPDGTYAPVIEGSDQEITDMVMNNAYEKYGNPLPEIVAKRVDRELTSIIKNGYSVLYLVAQRLVKKSNDDGYLVGSRGSVGSSLVATFSNITEVNPLPPHYVCPKCKSSEFHDSSEYGVGPDLPDKDCPNCGARYHKDGFDIPFEVFLGFDGDKEPDIDLNFSGDYQPIAHKYTEELFGEGKTFKAGTIGTIAEKTAYGFVAHYLEESGKQVTSAEIDRLVAGCTGIKRTTGQHPGGIMVVPEDKEIYDFCPIQRPADDTKSSITTTHFDYHSISGRLLKLDILGHDDPTVIRMLEDLTGIDATSIPLDDKETMSIFTSTKALKLEDPDMGSPLGTYGIPEFGTGFTQSMLLDTKPTAFADLIRISGLSHGTDVWLGNAQTLIQEGTCTIKDVINTRDSIMIYLMQKGLPPKTSFIIMEKVRKGKGLTEEDIVIMREHDVPEWYIDSCQKIKYMFPKAHAAAYVTMAFRIAYFKVHHPLAYYATYFSIRGEDFDAHVAVQGKEFVRKEIKIIRDKGNDATTKEKSKLTVLELILEMYCRGFGFLPVDLMKSHSNKFIIKGDKLLPPFSGLEGIGEKAAQNLYEAREEGPFLSIEDLQRRSKISKTNIDVLSKHGAINFLPENNQISLFSL